MLGKLIKIIAALFGALLLGIGIRWLVDPVSAAGALGMDLLDGAGRSTQIGDFSAFFIVGGSLALLGLIKNQAALLVAPAALTGCAALLRIFAWLVHDAAFAPQLILPEVLMCIVFVLAQRQMNKEH